MSWKKQTVNLSRINKVVDYLKNEGNKYTLSILGKVEGQGLNDILQNEEWRVYVIRRLDYDDKVILERIVQNNDMELDDFILSFRFYKKDLPDNWYYKIGK